MSSGRRKENTLCIANDPILSGQHCRIFFENKTFFLVDLDSTNGTGVRLSFAKELSDGHQLEMSSIFGCGVTKFHVQELCVPKKSKHT